MIKNLLKKLNFITIAFINVLKSLSKTSDWKIIHIPDLESYNYLPKISGKMIENQNNTLSFTHFSEGAVSPKHRHPIEESLYIIEGEGDFLIGNSNSPVKKGDFIIIPPMILHQFKAAKDTHAIEIFYPNLPPFITNKLKGIK